MKIESIIRRKNGTRVELDDSVYHFKPTDTDERHLCDVEITEHVKRFLSIPEGYQPAELTSAAPVAPAAPVEPAAPTAPAAPVETVADQPVLGALVGVVEQNGAVTKLEELPRDQLLVLARDMDIKGAEDMSDEDLAAAVRAEPVVPGDAVDESVKDEPNAVDAELNRDELAKQYEAKFGKKPHHKLSAQRIQQVLAEEDE